MVALVVKAHHFQCSLIKICGIDPALLSQALWLSTEWLRPSCWFFFASVVSHMFSVYCLNVPGSFCMVWYLWSVGSKHTAPVEIISVTVDSRGQNSFKINPPVGAETPMRTIMCSSPWWPSQNIRIKERKHGIMVLLGGLWSIVLVYI